ncbi:MAG TPA: alpha-2-macroglobulin family protein, partial [Pyrinomonadaceae bacterium]|nr:alpha-2-macroglobulin family protein [Pyrinomonadaceae bacterium]
TELRKTNFDLNSIRDPWHNPFKITFEVGGTNLQIRITSIEPAATSADAEFLVWLSTIDYFAEHRSRIDLALDKCLRETGSYPANETELHDTLLAAGIDTTKLLDPWNQSYYFVFQSQLFYGDRVTLEARAVYNQPTTQQLRVIPVTKTARTIRIKSAGADGTIGTPDDFELASFNATLAEQSGTDTEPRRVSAPVSFSGSTGAITGVVMDAVGASVPGTQVTAKPQTTEQVFEATSDDTGKYLIRNLPAGVYEVRASSPGFKDMVVSQVVVRSSELIHLNFTLEVGAVAETVTVTSGAATVNVTSASISELKVDGLRNLLLLAPGVAAAKQQLSTPRVREYFPETLLWQPQLTTDKKGRAQLDFKLADNITTWKMSVIGSTEDGEIGLAETDIRAFQPFFAELDPPRILTQGDRISLPVVLRNYLDKKQSVDVILKPETWFKILDTNQKQTDVPAGEARNAVFNLQAVTAIENGKQQISALASDFSDAIEKPVSVHPDGEERAETTSDVLERATSLNINLPLNTIPQSARVELKLYPNLMTHVWESVEGIMKRPYGCGEQTISSTYPSLMMLRYLKSEKTDSPIASKASKYVDLGYQRLLGYQSTSGGFTYWGHGDTDIALTAYAIRFLHDVAEVKSIDDSAAENARRWLITQQRQDGSWAALDWNHKEDVRRSAVLTALVARSLAVTEPKGYPAANSSLTKALAYLDSRGNAFDEPYLIASYALASSLAGLEDQAHRANSKLRELAKTEGPRSYWALETNTPFYGWGLAGRIETTALAVQALANESTSADEFRNLRTRGLLFLIQNQDRYGVWHSTQATVNVLDAMLSVLSTSARELGVSQSIDVTVNGKMIEHVSLPTDKRLLAPVSIDLSSEIKPNSNVIELRRTGSGSPVGLQVVTTYYVPWLSDVEASRDRVSNAERLKLATSYDKHDAAIGSEITCHVKAERVGLQGYGMLLAEIGLPPGVDVDRASLETAMRGSDWSISQYDVLPDRVVIYLWPRAGGSEFSFKFRPRLAVTAKASASSIYDYYNPEAKAMVAPGTFVVR